MDELLNDIRNEGKTLVQQHKDKRGDKSSQDKGKKSNLCFGNNQNNSDDENGGDDDDDNNIRKCFSCKGTRKIVNKGVGEDNQRNGKEMGKGDKQQMMS